jgi:hypothetical protein
MTALTAFFTRWRAWKRALKFIALYSTNMVVRRETVIVIQTHADLELDEIRTALPGWHMGWSGDDQVRLTPPAVKPQWRGL